MDEKMKKPIANVYQKKKKYFFQSGKTKYPINKTFAKKLNRRIRGKNRKIPEM